VIPALRFKTLRLTTDLLFQKEIKDRLTLTRMNGIRTASPVTNSKFGLGVRDFISGKFYSSRKVAGSIPDGVTGIFH
jgi:hypothetical protein